MLSIIKMTVSSTEFQQNVGYYLALAEKGEEITISKSKPKKAVFTLKKRLEKKIDEKPKTMADKLKELEKYMFESDESGLELQRRVRS